MTRKVLICTIGVTPQVVTETVWALKRDRDWTPDEIEVITTAFALSRIRTMLQTRDGPLAKLMGRAPPTTVFIPREDDTADVITSGGPEPHLSADALRDVATEEQANLMGNLILRRIARVCFDPDAELHVSVAGGRKTMSAHALLALSVVGRAGDRASHVLVSPRDYEDNPEFFYPDQGGRIHRTAELRPYAPDPLPPPSLDPAKACVSLVPTLHILARYPLRDPSALTTRGMLDFARHNNLAIALKEQPSLVLDTSRNEVILCGEAVRLTPKLFALFRLMSEARRGRWNPLGEPGTEGQTTVATLVEGEDPTGAPLHTYFQRYLTEAANVIESGDANDIVGSWRDAMNAADPGYRLDRVASQLRPNLVHLRTELQQAFGAPAVDKLLLRKKKRAGGSPFGLSIPSRAITII